MPVAFGAKQSAGSNRIRMIPENQNKALHSWQTSSRYWDKYRGLIAEMFAPLTSGLVEEAQIGIGQKVLDIGGGSGEPSLTISRIVGPAGSVMYTDPVAGMLESAQAEAGRRGLTNIHFTQCSADDLPFADRTFDATVGRLSAMFFAVSVEAFFEQPRALRARHPQLYEQLQQYFQQDPVEYSAEIQSI